MRMSINTFGLGSQNSEHAKCMIKKVTQSFCLGLLMVVFISYEAKDNVNTTSKMRYPSLE